MIQEKGQKKEYHLPTTDGSPAARKKRKCDLVSYQELPEYMKDNEFILNYYRSEWPLKQALFSIFRWHNETLNIWTHLIGFALILVLIVANSSHLYQLADFMTVVLRNFPAGSEAKISRNTKDILQGVPTRMVDWMMTGKESQMVIKTGEMSAASTWPLYVFLAGSVFCFLSSSVCHLFCCHSQPMNLVLTQMDYVGIAVMIFTSYFPPMYYIFQCSPPWHIVYLTGTSIIGICITLTLLTPAFARGKYRSFRACLFIAMGLFGLIPAIHALVVYWSDPYRNVMLAYEGAMALFYIIGAMFYVSRIPERWKPGAFDLVGQSHQIFHVFVIFGALAHYGAARVFLEYRSRLGCHRGD
ncbi:unnamed protein product [Cuscuta epithymum]|uniref:Heptahelical transmembrane protein 1-like n=1 Tax=Cuscuta epithymum TaxID=186058 RepID=A0AAV0CVX3_9ASTE|nr:unnamed protein product [Cuscuta epithymum]